MPQTEWLMVPMRGQKTVEAAREPERGHPGGSTLDSNALPDYNQLRTVPSRSRQDDRAPVSPFLTNVAALDLAERSGCVNFQLISRERLLWPDKALLET
jgi:hypothetical protein